MDAPHPVEEDTAEKLIQKTTSKITQSNATSIVTPLPNKTNLVMSAFNETKNITNSSIFTPDDPLKAAAILFNDGELDRLHRLRDNGTPGTEHWYGPYPTTLSLIILLHAIFFLQWNARKTRKQVLVSYKQLVQQKQYHRGVLAILSHPPLDARTRNEGISSNLSIDMGNALDPGRSQLHRFQQLLYPLWKGHLSGFPLLLYNSHILWSCRALEPVSPSSFHYARMLLGLTVVALAIELRIDSYMMHKTHGMAEIGFEHMSAAMHTRRHILNRTKGSITVLSAALLLLYHTVLPHVSLPIIPFLPFSFYFPPSLAYTICWGFLLVLSWNAHPIASVCFGSFSGLLWVFGLTKFLGDFYWGSCLLLWIVLASALSCRGSDLSLPGWVPCIDYVAWDRQGRILTRDGEDASSALGSREDDTDDEEDENADEGEEVDNMELQPLRSGPDSTLRGRVPLMNMESDDMDVPSSSRTPLTRQRRGGGSSGLETDTLR